MYKAGHHFRVIITELAEPAVLARVVVSTRAAYRSTDGGYVSRVAGYLANYHANSWLTPSPVKWNIDRESTLSSSPANHGADSRLAHCTDVAYGILRNIVGVEKPLDSSINEQSLDSSVLDINIKR